MGLKIHFCILVVLSLCLPMLGNTLAATNTYYSIGPDYDVGAINRASFPPGFIFGTASSAYQYEGAAAVDGKGPSNWDNFTHAYPEKIADRSNGDVALDSYHRYKEDVLLVKEVGLDAYRFSISWSRLVPKGKVSKDEKGVLQGVSQKGLEYYHNLIDEILAKGLTPFATLFHWDVPQALEDEYRGFISEKIVDDFRDYVDLCFSEFGGKVKHWITINEPWSFTNGGYAEGTFAPGRCSAHVNSTCLGGNSGTEPYLVQHHILLAHAAAVALYRQKYQGEGDNKGQIGITIITWWIMPLTQMQHDVDAAARALDFMFGWSMDPITNGDYPKSMRKLVGNRLPSFTEEQSKSLIGSYDFVGLNYYSARYATHNSDPINAPPCYPTDSLTTLTAVRNGVDIGPKAASDWLYIYPRGIYDLLLYTKEKYNDPLIYITENGVDEVIGEGSLEEALMDRGRAQFYHDHLTYLQLAIKKGVKVKGFFIWSLLDNFEWAVGYTVQFGIHYIDFKDNLKRYPKLSAYWFQNFLANK